MIRSVLMISLLVMQILHVLILPVIRSVLMISLRRVLAALSLQALFARQASLRAPCSSLPASCSLFLLPFSVPSSQ